MKFKKSFTQLKAFLLKNKLSITNDTKIYDDKVSYDSKGNTVQALTFIKSTLKVGIFIKLAKSYN